MDLPDLNAALKEMYDYRIYTNLSVRVPLTMFSISDLRLMGMSETVRDAYKNDPTARSALTTYWAEGGYAGLSEVEFLTKLGLL